MRKIKIPCKYRLWIWRGTVGWWLAPLGGVIGGFVEWCDCGDFGEEATEVFLNIWNLG